MFFYDLSLYVWMAIAFPAFWMYDLPRNSCEAIACKYMKLLANNHSKAVVLLLLDTLFYVAIIVRGSSVFGFCFVMHYFVLILGLQSTC